MVELIKFSALTLFAYTAPPWVPWLPAMMQFSKFATDAVFVIYMKPPRLEETLPVMKHLKKLAVAVLMWTPPE